MANSFHYANAITPTPCLAWRQLTDAARIAHISDTLSEYTPFLKNSIGVVDAKQDGQIIVELLEPMHAGKRGTVLLDFETMLKDKIDAGLVVWLASLGDRSSLRNLRGIEVGT